MPWNPATITADLIAWIAGKTQEDINKQLLQYAGDIFVDVAALYSYIFGPATERATELANIQTSVDELQSVAHGLGAIQTEMVSVLNDLSSLLGRPAGSSGDPVSIGTGGGADVAAAVWAFLFQSGHSARSCLESAGVMGFNARFQAYPLAGAPGFGLHVDDVVPAQWQTVYTLPQPDWASILPADTPLSWLQRTEPNYSWVLHSWYDTPSAYVEAGKPAELVFLLTDLEWAALLAGLGGAAGGVPPYPGLAGVTLGTPVALADHAKVDSATYGVLGKMDGIFIVLDTVAPEVGLRQVEDVYNYYRLGWLVFEDGDANCDRVQFFGPHRDVFTPEQFSSPAAVVVSCRPGTSGTITPWVVST